MKKPTGFPAIILGVQRRGAGTSGYPWPISGASDGGRRQPGCALRSEAGPAREGRSGDLAQQFNLLMEIHEELNRVYDAVNQIQDVRSQIAGLKRRLPENASAKTIASSADDLEKKLVDVRDQFINLTISANEDSLAYPPQIDAKLAYLAMDVGSADSAPTEAEQLRIREAEAAKRGTVSRGMTCKVTILPTFGS